jgi:hypothetical protein
MYTVIDLSLSHDYRDKIMEILKPKGNACRNNQHKIKPDGSVYHLNLKNRSILLHDIILWRSKPSGENHPLWQYWISTQKRIQDPNRYF